MTTIVIMPGGFHPFHAGHYALYQSAQRAFPGAEVFVAATNDTSSRPFPFAVKEKLARLAGVEPGHFVQVRSPFRAEEITSKFDPDRDRLIFVRSEKDADKPPQAGGIKRDGSAAYLQPLAGQTNIRPFKEHAYMAYLPTVEFGPGMTSATEIRTAWSTLNEKRKTALVMSLYPRTQSNPKLANTVVKLLDAAIDTQDVAEGSDTETNYDGNLLVSLIQNYTPQSYAGDQIKQDFNDPASLPFHLDDVVGLIDEIFYESLENGSQGIVLPDEKQDLRFFYQAAKKSQKQGMAENFADGRNPQDKGDAKRHGINTKASVSSLRKTAKQGGRKGQLAHWLANMKAGRAKNEDVDSDYIEEKWSAKYKSSINCADPKGFSQKAHCAGRKK